MTPNDDIDPREENEATNATEAPEATEARDPVWKLLLEARKPEVSPFFARNVLREVRKLEDEETSLPAGLNSLKALFTIPRLALTGAVAVLILVAVVNLPGPADTNPVPDVADTTSTSDPAPDPVVADASPVEDPAPADASFDIDDYQEEVEMIDYLDGLLAVQDVEILDDDALAELLF